MNIFIYKLLKMVVLVLHTCSASIMHPSLSFYHQFLRELSITLREYVHYRFEVFNHYSIIEVLLHLKTFNINNPTVYCHSMMHYFAYIKNCDLYSYANINAIVDYQSKQGILLPATNLQWAIY